MARSVADGGGRGRPPVVCWTGRPASPRCPVCGRFTLTKPARRVADLFRLPEPPAELRPRYNIAPSQPVPVVGLKPDGVTRGLALLK